MKDEAAHALACRVLREVGRAITGIGLLLFWLRVILMVIPGLDDPLTAAVGQTGYALAAAGSVGLAVIIALLFPPSGKMGVDLILGLACILTGVIGLLFVLVEDGVYKGLFYSLFAAAVLIIGGYNLALATVARPRRHRRR
jgi:hypothetical protein